MERIQKRKKRMEKIHNGIRSKIRRIEKKLDILFDTTQNTDYLEIKNKLEEVVEEFDKLNYGV